MADKTKNVQLKERDLPITGFETAPELYVDGYQGVSVKNGVAKIHFHTIVFDPTTEKMTRRVAFTMVVSVDAFVSIVNAQNKLIEQLRGDGIIVEAEQKETSDA